MPQTADRRTITTRTVADIKAEAQRLKEAPSLSAVGTWSAGQNMQHLAKTMRASLDEFPFTLALPLRIMGKLMKKKFLSKPFKSGFKLRGDSMKLLPDDNVPTDQGADELIAECDRILGGAAYISRSPFLGAMSTDDWNRLHTLHADLHLSHILPEDAN